MGLLPRAKLRGTTTYPNRTAAALAGIRPHIRGKTSLRVVDVGPGLAWKRTARWLPPGRKARKGFLGARDRAVKYLDRVARRLVGSGKALTTFEPHEIADTIAAELGPQGKAHVYVVDNKPETGEALRNTRRPKASPVSLEFLQRDLHRGGLPTQADLVFAVRLFMHVDRRMGLHSLAESLRPGGLLVTGPLRPMEVRDFGFSLVGRFDNQFLYQKK